MAKKLLCIIVSAMLAICCVFTAAACGNDDSDGDNNPALSGSDNGSKGILYGEVGSNEYEVVGYVGSDKDVKIPARHNGKPVVGVACCAFYKLDIESINLPDGIEYLDPNIIYDCGRLASVNIPSSVTQIHSSTFGAWHLENSAPIVKNDKWENDALYIDGCLISVRYGGEPVDEFTVKEGTRLIADGAIGTNIKSLIIPDSVEIVCELFSYREFAVGLSSIKIGKGVKKMGGLGSTGIVHNDEYWDGDRLVVDGCLLATSGDGSFNVGNDIRVIADGAFSTDSPMNAKASRFTSIKVASDHKTYYSKDNCVIERNSERLVGCAVNTPIPNNVKIIGTCAINVEARSANVTGETFYFPDSVEVIEEACMSTTWGGAYSLGKNIKSAYTSFGVNAHYEYRGGIADLCRLKLLGWWNMANPTSPFSADTDFTVGGKKITELTVPSGIECLRMSCALSTVTELTLSDSVAYIGFYSLSPNIERLNIGKGIKCIGTQAMQFNGVSSIYYDGTIADWCAKPIYVRAFDNHFGCEKFYVGGEEINDIEVPSTVGAIAYGAFAGIPLTSVHIPSSVNRIGELAFVSTRLLSAIFDDAEGWNVDDNKFGDPSTAAHALSYVGVAESELDMVYPGEFYKL